jgi:Uma2 family endonuclease
VELAVEVADRTLEFDMTVKAGLYAWAALKEYWVVDVRGRRVIVHRSPGDGRFASIMAYGEGEYVSPPAQPEARIEVASAFSA